MTEWRFENETAAVNTLTPITVGWRIATSDHSKSRTTAALDSASLGVRFLQDTFSIKKRSSSLAEVNLNYIIDSMSICSMKPSDDRKHDRLKDDVYVGFWLGVMPSTFPLKHCFPASLYLATSGSGQRSPL